MKDLSLNIHSNNSTIMVAACLCAATPFTQPMLDSFVGAAGFPSVVRLLRDSTCPEIVGHTANLIFRLLLEGGDPHLFGREVADKLHEAGGSSLRILVHTYRAFTWNWSSKSWWKLCQVYARMFPCLHLFPHCLHCYFLLAPTISCPVCLFSLKLFWFLSISLRLSLSPPLAPRPSLSLSTRYLFRDRGCCSLFSCLPF